MNHVLLGQLLEILDTPQRLPALSCALRRARPGEITATTVVGVLGRDDVDAFNRLVAEIADESDLDTEVRLHVGSYAVRFSRRAERT